MPTDGDVCEADLHSHDYRCTVLDYSTHLVGALIISYKAAILHHIWTIF